MADKTEWQLAPTEPTQEMVRAGMKRMFDEKRYSATWDDVIHLMYCDMVKAAPKPDHSGDAAEMVTAAPPPAGAHQAVASQWDQAIAEVTKAARAPDAWKDLFWSVARELNCLPSAFPDGNDHVLRQAKKLAALAATRAPEAAPSAKEGEAHKAVSDLAQAVAFLDQVRVAAKNSEEVTSTGISRDASQWLERAARSVVSVFEGLTPAGGGSGINGDWYCESHPEHLMGHNGCKGAGIIEAARIPMFVALLKSARQEAREAGQIRDDTIAQVRAQAGKGAAS